MNIPNKNPQKAIMNGAASFVTLSLLPFVEVIFNSIQNSEAQIKLLELAISGKMFPQLYLVLFLASLTVIYIISYFFAEKDENGPWTKIENLSIPSLWKIVVKSAA